MLLNAIYIGEGYGSDHKADEWVARRRALGYRMIDGTIITRKQRFLYIRRGWRMER